MIAFYETERKSLAGKELRPRNAPIRSADGLRKPYGGLLGSGACTKVHFSALFEHRTGRNEHRIGHDRPVFDPSRTEFVRRDERGR